MKGKRNIIAIFLSLLAISAFGQGKLDGRTIVQMIKDRPNGDTRTASVELKLINKRGRARVRRLRSQEIEVGNGKDTKTIMVFEYPGDVQGTAFLSWGYDDPNRDDDRWLYLPAMRKVRRISGSSAKTDYFMGTDFTYDDMGTRHVDEDKHKLLREEKAKDGSECWVIESIPVDKRTIYARKVVWVRKDCLVPVRVEFYDRLGKLHRELEVEGIAKMGKYWTFSKQTMKNVQTGHQTVITLTEQKFDEPMDESQFTVARLSQLR